MQIKEMFKKSITRDIQGVVIAGQGEKTNIATELEEYVVTPELQRHFADFFSAYAKGINGETTKMGVWISGFFGSGKSHLLKILSYILDNEVVGGKRAIDYFIDDKKITDPMVLADMQLAANTPSDIIIFNIDAKSESDGKSNKDAIVNVFLTMPENMKDWNKYNAEITLKVGMIKNFLQFSVTGGFNHFDSRGNNYSHTHSNFYYRADVLAMYKKWMLIGQLQPFDERLYGETVIKDGNYHYLAIRYNATNFSFGIGAFNPFKNVSRTIMENKNAQAPFRRESFSDASRILVATLTWNFNFGKTHLVGTKSLNNQDTDYGIKGSYK